MVLKVTLRIVLHAGDTVVAESHDEVLWQRVLAAVTEPDEPADAPDSRVTPAGGAGPAADDAGPDDAGIVRAEPEPAPAVQDPLDRFAAELGLPRETILAACSPSTHPPYLRLDRDAWEEIRRSTPPRGPGSVSRAAIVAALLALWFRCARLGSPTVKMVHKVLRTIGLRDKNAVRVVREAEWLQLRGAEVVLNLSKVSRAVRLARAFCARDWSDYRAR